MPVSRALCLAICLGVPLAACSGHSKSPSDPIAASSAGPVIRNENDRSERVLNVYNWSDFIEPSVVTDFAKEFGIQVNYDVYDTNEMMEVKLLTGHTNYDIVVPGGSFFERELKAGLYQKLNKNLLPNLTNLDPGAIQATAILDPGNQYGVDYTWLVSVGLGYDLAQVKARRADAPVDSWRLIFDPAVVASFKDCGVSVLDAPDDVLSAAFAYLGKDLNSESFEDLRSAEAVLLKIRPFIRSIDSTHYIGDLANGDICVALGWSGDIASARQRVRESGKTVIIGYSIPKEGSLQIADVMAIPVGAPHTINAHLFLNYLLRPDVAAKNSMTTNYASGVAGSVTLVSDSLRNDDAAYPGADARKRLVPMRARSQEFTRAMNRVWTRFKTGQ